jgi:pyruvate dehydrogenase E2 component (dihydrolipoamide acetyltransferase)
MAYVVVMPKLGLTMREGLVARWLVELGEHVAEEAPLLEVETDKITTEVGSPASGALLRRVESEVEVPVGEPIAILGDPTEDISSIALYAPEAVP